MKLGFYELLGLLVVVMLISLWIDIRLYGKDNNDDTR